MFERASSKLQDARTAFRTMMDAQEAGDFLTVRADYNAFLAAINAVFDALRKDGAKLPGFRRWHDQARQQIENDDLLSFVRKSRQEDLHEGEPQLQTNAGLVILQRLNTDEVGPPPVSGARLEVGPEGANWRIHEGTPQEERVPARKGVKVRLSVLLKNAAATHLGKPLESGYPAEICQKAIAYYEGLIQEARQKFG